MALLDYLVPAFSGEAYGDRGLLDGLPVGVWLMSKLTVAPQRVPDQGGTRQFRWARPDDFRYRVIVNPDGTRSVMRSELTRDGARVMLVDPHYDKAVPKAQYQAFASTAMVDPKQDWKRDELTLFENLKWNLFLLGTHAYVSSPLWLPPVMLYGAYRLSTRKASKGK